MEKYENEKGVWRTVSGRRIFIRSGESLGSAMARSGKFKREDVRQAKASVSQIDRYNKTSKKSLKARQDAIKKMKNKEYRFEGTISSKNQAEKNRINENATINKEAKTRVERNKERYSETDRRELRREELQKRLDAEKLYNKNRQLYKQHGGFYNKENNEETNNAWKEWVNNREKARKLQDNANNEDTRKLIREYQAKKQSNNKVDNEYTRQQLKDKYGTDDVELINAGKEKENRVKLIDEKQYNSVVDRYNKDEKFRNRLKEEHDKTIEATRKEVKAFLQDKNFFDRKGIKTEDDLYNTINDNYYNISREDFDKIYKEEYNKNAKEAYDTRQREGLDKFIQKTDMYGGEYEYSKEDLKRMEEQGIRPMAHSYTGGGWEGVNSHKNLSTSEQAKAITTEMKKQFPDVKIARKSDIYSGGSSIDFNIMSSDKDLFVSDKEIDKMEDFGNITSSYEWERWANANVKDYEKTHSYWDSDKRKYAKEVLNNLKKRDIQAVRGNEWFLSDYGKKVVSALNKEANSYTYSDNDGMVDYFNHGTYMHISIGKWDKPYQVNDTKAKIEKYMKRKGK